MEAVEPTTTTTTTTASSGKDGSCQSGNDCVVATCIVAAGGGRVGGGGVATALALMAVRIVPSSSASAPLARHRHLQPHSLHLILFLGYASEHRIG